MRYIDQRKIWVSLSTCVLAASLLAMHRPASAQDDDRGSYAVREDGVDRSSVGRGDAEQGPVRLARFSFVRGNVSWRPDDAAEWSSGAVNLPVRQGAQLWVTDGGRAEVQFDDGSLLRMGNGAIVTLQTLYSDSEGEFTEIRLTQGVATLRLKHEHSVYQVNTPVGSVKAVGPARVRIGASDGLEVAVSQGGATVETPQDKVALKRGEYVDIADERSEFRVRALPRPDTWEAWNDERDARLEAMERDASENSLPSNISLVATDLDLNGTWRTDETYGRVWCPRVAAPDWRPYYYGHWTWVNPFGWTWVSDESWGWAPYHYGSWVHRPFGWAWVPGPAYQCWSPAVVHFTECDNQVVWCALAPREVYYDNRVALGFRHGNWSLFFSIGQAAVYYPGARGYCEPHPWRNVSVNRGVVVNNIQVNNYYRQTNEYFAASHNAYAANRFVPLNARAAQGGVTASLAEFGGRARYQALPTGSESVFNRGRTIVATSANASPLAGPIGVKPLQTSTTPNRVFSPVVRSTEAAAIKPVFRAPVRGAIAQTSVPIKTVDVIGGGRGQIGRTPGANDGVGRRIDSGRADVVPNGGGRTERGDSTIGRVRDARRDVGAGTPGAEPWNRRSATDNGDRPRRDRPRQSDPAGSTEPRRDRPRQSDPAGSTEPRREPPRQDPPRQSDPVRPTEPRREPPRQDPPSGDKDRDRGSGRGGDRNGDRNGDRGKEKDSGDVPHPGSRSRGRGGI